MKGYDHDALMRNWRPVAPFRDRWDDGPVGEVIPIGEYPIKALKIALKHRKELGTPLNVGLVAL